MEIETRKYVNNKGVEVYEYGEKFDFDKVKEGDILVICKADYYMNNDKYPNEREFGLTKVKNVDVENGIITITGDYKFKQDYETFRPYSGYKEVKYLNRLKINREQRWTEMKVLYNNKQYNISRKEVYETNAIYQGYYLFMYDKKWEEKINRCVEDNKLRIERETLEKKEKEDKINAKQKYQDAYDNEINPIKEQIKKLQEELYYKTHSAFETHFCKNCKYYAEHPKTCKYEKYWQYNPDKNGFETDKSGAKLYTRPDSKCSFFEPNDSNLEPTVSDLIEEYNVDIDSDIKWRKSYEDYKLMTRNIFNMLPKDKWQKIKDYYTKYKL